MSETHRTVDALGLFCPIPARLTRYALEEVAEGDLVTVLADDPEAWIDIPALVHRLGHELVETSVEEDRHRFVIRKL